MKEGERKKEKKERKERDICVFLSTLNIQVTFRSGFISMVSNPLPMLVILLIPCQTLYDEDNSPHPSHKQEGRQYHLLYNTFLYTTALPQLKIVLAFSF